MLKRLEQDVGAPHQALGLRGTDTYSTTMQHKTYSMNVSDMNEDEIDEAVADALHGIVAAMDLWQEKKSFHQDVTDALFDIMSRRDLTIFDVLIKRDEKVCEILDAPMKDIPEGRLLEGSIDTEVVRIYNLRSKDPDGNFELLYDNTFTKSVQMTLYTKRKRVKM
jgi:hypothetical protein